MAYIQIMSGTITLATAGVVEVLVDARQAFSNPPSDWGFQLIIDGTTVYDMGKATYPGDVVHFTGRIYCQAGPRTAVVNWAGDPKITLTLGTMSITGYENTSLQ